jgi:hypothetical protein
VADFQQTDDADGLVVIEAEDFSDERTAVDGSYWDNTTTLRGYFVSGAMQTVPSGDATYKDLAPAQRSAPVLKYVVNFVKGVSI